MNSGLPKTTRHRRPRGGFATLFAIFLLLLIAAVLPALAMTFAADAKRTRSQAEDAQLRQLLLAGAISATRQAAAGGFPTTRRTVALPSELTADGADVSLSSEQRDADRTAVTVRATLGKRSREQVLRFERRDDAWQPAAASIDAP
jgi:hypothetical protein